MKWNLKFAVASIAFSVLAPIAQAKDVSIMFGLALPPYVIQENNSGFEVDIIRAALAAKGHTLKPIYASFMMISQTLKENKADQTESCSF